MFDIQLFGRLEVRTRGICLTGADLGGVRPRSLLALIALRREASISELADVLGVTKKIVEFDLAELRRHLEPGVAPRDSVIITHRNRVSLNPDRVRVDVARFDELMTAAAGRPAGRAIKPLTAAAFLATHPLLEDEDAPWAAEARAEYKTRLAVAREMQPTG